MPGGEKGDKRCKKITRLRGRGRGRGRMGYFVDSYYMDY
jgi:hypothetical protein